MKIEDNKEENKTENEDATKYGEFISSFFSWNTLEGQKEKVEKLEKITSKENKDKKSK